MANSSFDVLEIRAIIAPHWTELYVLCGPASDGMLGVQGWHKRVIEPDVVVIDALRDALATSAFLTDPAWSQSAP